MDISPADVGQQRQLALVRLLLAIGGYTHQALIAYSDEAATILRRSYGNPADAPNTLRLLKAAWGDAYVQWVDKFEQARREAVLIAFGELAVMHRHYLGGALLESEPSPLSPVFERQLQEVLNAAQSRVYGDGFNLSQRIWQLEADSFEGIRRTVMGGISEQKSAWELAQEVEQYLGAGQDCPRWTVTRLYGLTKSDIASGDRTGLLKGEACTPERGVAYNALRLARNEITIASSEATHGILKRSPWVEAMKWNLSPSHPNIPCGCKDMATGGEHGNGVYGLNEISPPPKHVQCMCYLTSVQVSDDVFVAKMRGWLNGTEAWRGMDTYAAGISRSRFNIGDLGIIAGLEDTLYRWTFDLPAATQRWLPGLEP